MPIVAFVDNDNNGTPNAGDNFNTTVNQVYTGYLKMVKQYAVFDPATPNTPRAGMNFADPDAGKQPRPGDIIEYRVIYRNISERQSGNGTNVVLNANNVAIDENGTVAPNNWALDGADPDSNIDTVNVQNSASDSNGGSIQFFTGNPATNSTGAVDTGAATTRYVDRITQVNPAGSRASTNPAAPKTGDGVFRFRRTIFNP